MTQIDLFKELVVLDRNTLYTAVIVIKHLQINQISALNNP